MEAIVKNQELYEIVDAAMLREIASSVGRKLATDYVSQIQGISTVLGDEGVQLRIHVEGTFRDIQMQFVEEYVPVRTLFDDVNDSEL
jgi:hypothetical protein